MDDTGTPQTSAGPAPATSGFVRRHRTKIAYVTLVVACLLAISIIEQAITYLHKWINVRGEVLALAIVVAIHVSVRKGAEIPGLGRATGVGMGCIVAFVLGMIALFLMVGPMG